MVKILIKLAEQVLMGSRWMPCCEDGLLQLLSHGNESFIVPLGAPLNAGHLGLCELWSDRFDANIKACCCCPIHQGIPHLLVRVLGSLVAVHQELPRKE
jgi:hypothetical protein